MDGGVPADYVLFIVIVCGILLGCNDLIRWEGFCTMENQKHLHAYMKNIFPLVYFRDY